MRSMSDGDSRSAGISTPPGIGGMTEQGCIARSFLLHVQEPPLQEAHFFEASKRVGIEKPLPQTLPQTAE
jgi:hypothetical protein